MKLYNPFRPHIVELQGKYAIRRFHSVCFWAYLDLFDFRTGGGIKWRNAKFRSPWCLTGDPTEALATWNYFQENSPRNLVVRWCRTISVSRVIDPEALKKRAMKYKLQGKEAI